MPLLVVCFLLAVAVPVGIGLLAHRGRWSVAGGPLRWGQAATTRFGPVGGTLLVLVGGLAVAFVVSLGLGFLAKSLQSSIDEPTFRWVVARVHDNTFTRGQNKLTETGDNAIVQLVLLVSVIVLGVRFGRRWWLPVLSLAIAYFGEHYVQKALAKIVDRGHPPTTLGTFPSGGVGRILAVYGTVIVLIIVASPSMSRAWRAGLWTGVVTAASVEAYSRLYLSKHWLTDALSGLPFGALLMLVNVSIVGALAAAALPPAAVPVDDHGPGHVGTPRAAKQPA